MIAESIIGSALGGLFRLAPEVIQHLDRKNERKHEVQMFDRQLQADELRSKLRVHEAEVQGEINLDIAGVETLKAAIQQQTEITKAAGGWAASLSASVRPVSTYWLLALYGTAKLAMAASLHAAGVPVLTVAQTVYTPEDHALLSGVMFYWFLDRSILKKR